MGTRGTGSSDKYLGYFVVLPFSLLASMYLTLSSEYAVLELLGMLFCFPVAFIQLQTKICNFFSILSISSPTPRSWSLKETLWLNLGLPGGRRRVRWTSGILW